MLKTAFQQLLKSKYDNHKIYFHNLSHFDGVYILNVLSDLSNTQLSISRHDGKIINLQLSFGLKYNIHFRDSLLMMPLSLKQLTQSFKVDNKDLFPIFAANDLSLNYVGNVPNKSYFKDISESDYNNYVNSFKS
jgi:hypothetical protein